MATLATYEHKLVLAKKNFDIKNQKVAEEGNSVHEDGEFFDEAFEEKSLKEEKANLKNFEVFREGFEKKFRGDVEEENVNNHNNNEDETQEYKETDKRILNDTNKQTETQNVKNEKEGKDIKSEIDAHQYKRIEEEKEEYKKEDKAESEKYEYYKGAYKSGYKQHNNEEYSNTITYMQKEEYKYKQKQAEKKEYKDGYKNTNSEIPDLLIDSRPDVPISSIHQFCKNLSHFKHKKLGNYPLLGHQNPPIHPMDRSFYPHAFRNLPPLNPIHPLNLDPHLTNIKVLIIISIIVFVVSRIYFTLFVIVSIIFIKLS